MHITFVTETHPPEINGVALTVARAVAFLRRQGHRIDLVRPAQAHERPGADRNVWRSRGCPIPMYPQMRFGWARPAALEGRFAQTGTQLVHVATEGPLGWVAVGAATRLGLPVTTDFRTNFHQYSRYYGAGWLEPLIRGYLRRFHNRADCTFVATPTLRRELGSAGFERLEVAGRGVDLERFAPARRSAALRRSWGGDDGGPVLLYVGRLAAEKNVELALEAFRNAQRLAREARMIVVGEGPRRRRLERDYPEARFVGPMTGAALAEHYASADLFLFPSLSETFGNVTLEALASGLPVIAFDHAAAGQFLTDRCNGRLVRPGNDAGFVVATCLAVAQRYRLAAMSEAARASVVALDWDGVLQRFERRLQDVVDDARLQRPMPAFAA